jgi:hypothetical protein
MEKKWDVFFIDGRRESTLPTYLGLIGKGKHLLVHLIDLSRDIC